MYQYEEQYYLQDARQSVGNAMLWWAKGSRGYTTDLTKAEVFSKTDAYLHHLDRETDIPWSRTYIDSVAAPTVDMQNADRAVLNLQGMTIYNQEAIYG